MSLLVGGIHIQWYKESIMVFFLLFVFATNPLIQTGIIAVTPEFNPIQDTKLYGYIIPVDINQNNTVQTSIFQCINHLLQSKVEVYWMNNTVSYLAKPSFSTISLSSTQFQKGSFLIPYTNDQGKNVNITSVMYKHTITSSLISYTLASSITGFNGFRLSEPRIVHYDKNVVMPFAWNLLTNLGFHHQEFIMDENIIHDELTPEKYDIFFIGGQLGSDIEVLKSLLSSEWDICTEKIRNFLINGGNYIGICHGSGRSATKVEKPFYASSDLKYTQLFNYLGFYLKIVDRAIYRALPGGGFVDIEFSDMNHPISYGLPSLITNHSYGAGPMFLELPGTTSKSLGVIKDINRQSWNYSYWMDDSYWYTSDLVSQQMKDGKIQRWISNSKGKTVWVQSNYGDGKAIVFGGHPELNWNFAQYQWYDHPTTSFPVRVLGNTVLYLCSTPVDSLSFHHCIDFSPLHGSILTPPWIVETESVSFTAQILNHDSLYFCRWFSDYETLDVQDSKNMTVCFDGSGNYSLGFCIIDVNGSAWVDVVDITVHKKIYSQLSNDFLEGHTNNPLIFSVDISYGLPPYHYQWDFGDGNGSIDKSPVHQYTSPGCYHGAFMVTDTMNDVHSSDFWAVINDKHPAFTSTIETRPSLLPAGILINTSIIINCSTSGSYRYICHIGDQDPINSDLVTGTSYGFYHILNLSDDEQVFVDIENEYGESYSTYHRMKTNYIPIIDHIFPVEISTIGKYNEFRIFGADQDGDEFYINVDFGNGYIDSDNETIKDYVRFSEHFGFFIVGYAWDEPGEYMVRGQIIDSNGFKSEWRDLFSVTIQNPTLIDVFIEVLEKLGLISID